MHFESIRNPAGCVYFVVGLALATGHMHLGSILYCRTTCWVGFGKGAFILWGVRTIMQEHRRLGFCFIPPCSICLMSDGGGSILPTSDVKMICLNARQVLSITRRSLRMCRDIARISPLHMTGGSWRECRQDDTMTRVSDVHFAQDILATLLL